jgi:hypothetical protein
MRLKKVFAVVAAVGCLTVSAHAVDFTQVLGDLGKDAAQGYISPFVTWMGTGMNSGWYNSSKSLEMFGLPVGISVAQLGFPMIKVNDDMREFAFSGSLPVAPLIPHYDTLKAAAQSAGTPLPDYLSFAANVPTIFGSSKAAKITYADFFAPADAATKAYLFNDIDPITPGLQSVIDPNDSLTLPFAGIDFEGIAPSIPTITAFTVGVKSIPVIDNIQLGIRYFPTLEMDNFGEINMFGLKLQNEFTKFIPVLGKMPFLHTSAYWAMNNLSIKGGPTEITQGNWTAMLNVSADAKFFIGAGAFMGLGFQHSNLGLKVDMTPYGLQDFELDITGDNAFCFQLGGRLSIAWMDVWADMNLTGGTTVYNIGVTVIGLNKL